MNRNQRLAKKVAAGIKGAIRESGVPLSNLEGQIRMITDNGDTLVVYFNGVPPFTTVAVDDNGTVRTYLGHTGLPATFYAQDESDPS